MMKEELGNFQHKTNQRKMVVFSNMSFKKLRERNTRKYIFMFDFILVNFFPSFMIIIFIPMMIHTIEHIVEGVNACWNVRKRKNPPYYQWWPDRGGGGV